MNAPQPPALPANFLTAVRPDRAARHAAGLDRRREYPLEAHAALPQPDERRDANALLQEQDQGREPGLVPLRYERMGASPFAYLRGAAAVMASDLSLLPNTGISTQLCGDAHLANFGLFATAERRLIFDLNDFDETLPGPFEWDVKRLAASTLVAGRDLGLSGKQSRRAVRAGVRAYRETMAHLSTLSTMAAWTARVDAEVLTRRLRRTGLGKAVVKATASSQGRTSQTAALKLTEVVDGRRRFRNDPPVLMRVPDPELTGQRSGLATAYQEYLGTVPIDLVALLARFAFTDLAHKVVGVGSVGTRALLLLLESGDQEPLVLQMKQAGASVLERYLGPGPFEHAGQRVVSGQKALQAAGDPFLGWCRGSERAPFDFYVRQLHDHKAAIDLTKLDKESLRLYAAVCGGVLARAHARVADAAKITGYLGDTDTFDLAVAKFAVGYADITERDHVRLVSASPSQPEA